MITVEEATKIINGQSYNSKNISVSIHDFLGRTTSEPVLANRDCPAFDRLIMKGIVIKFGSF
jgi:molybdopterin biosynthesis enzyme